MARYQWLLVRRPEEKIITPNNARAYSERKTGWDVYSLFMDPLPMLVMRNNNDKHYKYDWRHDWHSTWSWKKGSTLTSAVELALSRLQRWNAFRGLTKKQRARVRNAALKHVPAVVEDLSCKLWEMDVRRIDDIRPSSEHYLPLIQILARAVGKISELKGNARANPMFGSKILHFLIPEFFPVWDTAIISKKCLSKLQNYACPSSLSEKLKGLAAKEYAAYLHLFLTELHKISNAQYMSAEEACLKRIDPQARSTVKEIIMYHYDDVSPTVFEICLMGRYV
jgi:hypothetical protein